MEIASLSKQAADIPPLIPKAHKDGGSKFSKRTDLVYKGSFNSKSAEPYVTNRKTETQIIQKLSCLHQRQRLDKIFSPSYQAGPETTEEASSETRCSWNKKMTIRTDMYAITENHG